MAPVKYCPVCGEQKKKNKLVLKQINFRLGVYLCEDKSCPYPEGYDFIEVERRDFKNLITQKQNRSNDENTEFDTWFENFLTDNGSNEATKSKNDSESITEDDLSKIIDEISGGRDETESDLGYDNGDILDWIDVFENTQSPDNDVSKQQIRNDQSVPNADQSNDQITEKVRKEIESEREIESEIEIGTNVMEHNIAADNGSSKICMPDIFNCLDIGRNNEEANESSKIESKSDYIINNIVFNNSSEKQSVSDLEDEFISNNQDADNNEEQLNDAFKSDTELSKKNNSILHYESTRKKCISEIVDKFISDNRLTSETETVLTDNENDIPRIANASISSAIDTSEIQEIPINNEEFSNQQNLENGCINTYSDNSRCQQVMNNCDDKSSTFKCGLYNRNSSAPNNIKKLNTVPPTGIRVLNFEQKRPAIVFDSVLNRQTKPKNKFRDVKITSIIIKPPNK